MNNKVMIIGAGPCGTSSAYELSKKEDIHIYLVEKNNYIGGLSTTFNYNGFLTDVGPHRFFSKNKKLYELIEHLLKDNWIKVDRLTRFYIKNRFFLYPVDLMDTLKKLGFADSFKIVRDFSFQKIKNILFPKKIISFEDKIISDFGRSLSELNMLNYTEKIWGLRCSEISPDWATQRIKNLSLLEILKKSFLKSETQAKTLVDRFYYPRYGTIMIYESMLDTVKNNFELKLKSLPVKIIHKNNKIESIVLNNNGKQEQISVDYLISTMPLTEFIKLFEPALPEYVTKSAEKLKFRSHLSLFIALDKDKVFDDQWIYFPELHIPFGRIMESKNFSQVMAPEGKTSLTLEFFCWKNDEIYNMSEDKLVEISLPYLEKIFGVSSKEIIFSKLHREDYAYPVYDLNYRENLDNIKNYLQNFENLIIAGRGGSFRYNNQDHAIEMGFLAARSIVDGKKYNIDEIGSEKDYFEKGYIK